MRPKNNRIRSAMALYCRVGEEDEWCVKKNSITQVSESKENGETKKVAQHWEQVRHHQALTPWSNGDVDFAVDIEDPYSKA